MTAARELEQKEIDWKKQGTLEYQQLARRSLETLQPVKPLDDDDPDRPRVKSSGFRPKRES